MLGAGLLLCTFALGYGHKKYNDTVMEKKIAIISLHSYINNGFLRDLADYYTYIKKVAEDLKFLPGKF